MRLPSVCHDAVSWLISLTHDPPGSLVLSLPLQNRCPRGFSVYPAASQPAVFALAGYPVHLADSQSARFSLGRMSELLAGKIQAGFGDASRWLKLFNAAYSEKLGMPVFPGSLNIALDHVFDWFDVRYKAHTIWFGREEYGGERDILLLPCELVSLDRRRAFLWTPTTAARDRRDPWVVEIVADINLRHHFGLQDGDVVEIRVPT
jgi:CTP-dependent riboflavin kinase